MSTVYDEFMVRRPSLLKVFSPYEVNVLGVICRHVDDSGVAVVTQSDLVEDAGATRRTVQRAVARLQAAHVVRVERHAVSPGECRSANHYRVTLGEVDGVVNSVVNFDVQGRMIRTEIDGVAQWVECYSVHDVRANWFRALGKNSDHGRLWKVVGIKTLTAVRSSRAAWVSKADFDKFMTERPESSRWTADDVRRMCCEIGDRTALRGIGGENVMGEIFEIKTQLAEIHDMLKSLMDMWK